VSPRSIASSGFPQLASAGNLWLWLPQARLTVMTGDPDRLEGSILAPNGAEPVDPFLTQPDRAELSGRPALELRGLVRWRSAGRDGEFGIGGHLGWVGPDSVRRTSRAIGGSAVVPLGARGELRGELFRGQVLAGLGGGGIGQNLVNLEPVETTGGWIQGVVFPAAAVELGLSAGFDDPEDSTIAPSGRLRNAVVAANLTWRPAPLVVGLEYRRIATRFRGATAATIGHHLALALGVEF